MALMQLSIYQVDAFTAEVFGGNPAAVVPLEKWLPNQVMQQIATENNLAETAFVVEREGRQELRWFTPSYEIDLCGHGTLAAAWVLFNRLEFQGGRVHFHSPLSGDLYATREEDKIRIDLPAWKPQAVDPPAGVANAFGIEPVAVYRKRDTILLFESEAQIRAAKPQAEVMAPWDSLLTIITAPGEDCDFVSRAFDPHDTLLEDPVTGSAHASLVPFWAERLGKKELRARQLSVRGGELFCSLQAERVLLAGQVAPYLDGFITIS